MKLERLSFPEALERLAKRAGVELDQTESHGPSRKEQLYAINSAAAAYYIEQLARTPVAMEYLRNRGLADQTISQFRLGYAAPDWEGFVQHLTKKGLNLEDAAELGLVRRNDRGGYYNWFRHRIIFPIFDIQERVIAFGGRAFTDDQPKYLNSPDTPVFNKTRSLYGLNFARKSISDEGGAVIVEGYMDLVTAHQAGFLNCVATLGTALTSEHIKILERYTNKMVLAYDADSAGMKAALRGAAMFEEAECDVRIARLPGGDDPDSLIRNGKSADFVAAITGALPIVDYKLAVLQERHDLSGPEGRSALLKDAVRVLVGVTTHTERERHIKLLARFHPNFETGTTRAEDHIRKDVEALIRQKMPQGSRFASNRVEIKIGTAREKAEKAVLSVILKGEGTDEIFESLTPDNFSDEIRRSAATILFERFSADKGINLPEILETVDPDVGRFMSEMAMRESEPITPQVLEEYISLIKNSKLKKARTSDVIASYMKDGTNAKEIDPSRWPLGRTAEEYEEFLRKSGRKPGPDNNGLTES